MISEEKIKRKYNQLKALQTSSLQPTITESELWEKATESVREDEQLKEINIESYFPDKKEQKAGKELLKKYLQDYSIETVSDRNTLCQLIYLEVLNLRLQRALNSAQKDTNTISMPLVDTMHKNIKELTSLKEKLGITGNKKNEQVQDGFSYLQIIKKKYKKWLEENQGSRTLWCPHCSKATLLKIKTDVWEAQKHPFFKDRILGNTHLIDLYKQGKVDRSDVAKIFEVSNDYVDWLVQKGWGLKTEDAKSEGTADTTNGINGTERQVDSQETTNSQPGVSE